MLDNIVLSQPPPEDTLDLCLHQIKRGVDAEGRYGEIIKIFGEYAETVTLKNLTEGEIYIRLTGKNIAVQHAIIVEAITFIAHGDWEIREGDKACQETQTT